MAAVIYFSSPLRQHHGLARHGAQPNERTGPTRLSRVSGANRLSSPTINSVVRRSEIILVLLYDVIWLKDYPDIIEGCGYVIVLISVIIITFADQIHESILQLKNRQSTMQAV